MNLYLNFQITSFAFTILLLFACKSNAGDNPIAKEAQTVYEEAVALHDEVMPKMGQTKSRIEELQQALNQLNVRGEEIDQERVQALETTQQNLQESYDGMMDWMKTLKPIPETMPGEVKLNQLLTTQQAQRTRIMEIKDQMNAALATATELLGVE